MPINMRNYKSGGIESPDYEKVRTFLLSLEGPIFTYARWDWMITHSYLDMKQLDRIGLWEEQGELVGIASFDVQLGNAYCLTKPEYAFLKKKMIAYAESNLKASDDFGLVINLNDHYFQKLVWNLGYRASSDKEEDALFDIEGYETLSYDLPEGYTITSMAECFDPYEYAHVLWTGFNHEKNGEGPFQFHEGIAKGVEAEMLRPHVDLDLKIAVLSPDNHFVSYGGFWVDSSLDYGVLEPLATDPDHRKKGLGKAVVYEGLNRLKALGVKKVLVGSSQAFYYGIGFSPYAVANIWTKKL